MIPGAKEIGGKASEASNISLIVIMRQDRKVKDSVELKNKIIAKKNWLINVITQC